MSEISRRELLRAIALSATLGGLTPIAAQQVHEMVAEEKAQAGGVYKTKALTEHEFATLTRLTDYIIPADDKSPAASAAGVPEWIDLMCSQNQEMQAAHTGGIAWLDDAMQKRCGRDFIGAPSDRQIVMLDLIAYRKNDDGELGPGIGYFALLRNMTSDGFHTSPTGIKDLNYLGNTAVSGFAVPQEAYDWAIAHSPFARGA